MGCLGLMTLAGCGGNSLVSANMKLLAPNSAATDKAKAILFKLNHGELNMTVPLTPCSRVAAGSIGSLTAPYKECPISTPQGHFVTFTTTADPNSGLAYTDRGPATFPDECYAYVRGLWWSWMIAANGTTS